METREMVHMNLYAGQEEKGRQNRLVDTAGEEKGGMNWESSTETYTLPCVKQIASGRLLCNWGSSTQCYVTT